ncbi:MAG: hypothetical protein RJB34_1274 [Pseudomonadota bacterium]|jgi:O-antigen/teichoic acid export membrane protein
MKNTFNYFGEVRASLIYRISAAFISFATLPLMIDYLGAELFGIWAIMLSILTWITFFDMGVGNGIRNNLAESITRNDRQRAKILISSGYFFMFIIACLFMLIGYAIFPTLDWQRIFNTKAYTNTGLSSSIFILLILISLNFVAIFVQQILAAAQKVSLTFLSQLLANILIILMVIIVDYSVNASIEVLALCYGVALLSSNIVISAIFFLKNRDLIPNFLIDTTIINQTIKIGLKFLVIQISVLILMTSDRILLTQFFGPSEVAPYEVVYKIFSVVTMVHGTMLAPLWSAFTDAETRNDQTWIKSMLRKQIQYLGLVIILALLLALLSPYLINFVGSGMVGYSKIMVGCMACMVIITSWANIFAIYLNGIGVLNVQFYTSIISIFLNFPISIWLVKTTDLGPSAIIVGTCISLLPAALFLPLQVFRRLNVPPSKYSI